MRVQEELERFTADMAYLDEHRRELLQRYPDRWVAIYQGRVVGAARALPRLMHQLERKGIPRGRAFVEYVTEKEELLILTPQEADGLSLPEF